MFSLLPHEELMGPQVPELSHVRVAVPLIPTGHASSMDWVASVMGQVKNPSST